MKSPPKIAGSNDEFATNHTKAQKSVSGSCTKLYEHYKSTIELFLRFLVPNYVVANCSNILCPGFLCLPRGGPCLPRADHHLTLTAALEPQPEPVIPGPPINGTPQPVKPPVSASPIIKSSLPDPSAVTPYTRNPYPNPRPIAPSPLGGIPPHHLLHQPPPG